MPRRARMYLLGFPYHIVQRGNNRESCIIEPKNYQRPLGSGVAIGRVCIVSVFDITKLWPIHRLDQEMSGGLGIMLDDVLAGIYGALALWVLATGLVYYF